MDNVHRRHDQPNPANANEANQAPAAGQQQQGMSWKGRMVCMAIAAGTFVLAANIAFPIGVIFCIGAYLMSSHLITDRQVAVVQPQNLLGRQPQPARDRRHERRRRVHQAQAAHGQRQQQEVNRPAAEARPVNRPERVAQGLGQNQARPAPDHRQQQELNMPAAVDEPAEQEHPANQPADFGQQGNIPPVLNEPVFDDLAAGHVPPDIPADVDDEGALDHDSDDTPTPQASLNAAALEDIDDFQEDREATPVPEPMPQEEQELAPVIIEDDEYEEDSIQAAPGNNILVELQRAREARQRAAQQHQASMRQAREQYDQHPEASLRSGFQGLRGGLAPGDEHAEASLVSLGSLSSLYPGSLQSLRPVAGQPDQPLMYPACGRLKPIATCRLPEAVAQDLDQYYTRRIAPGPDGGYYAFTVALLYHITSLDEQAVNGIIDSIKRPLETIEFLQFITLFEGAWDQLMEARALLNELNEEYQNHDHLAGLLRDRARLQPLVKILRLLVCHQIMAQPDRHYDRVYNCLNQNRLHGPLYEVAVAHGGRLDGREDITKYYAYLQAEPESPILLPELVCLSELIDGVRLSVYEVNHDGCQFSGDFEANQQCTVLMDNTDRVNGQKFMAAIPEQTVQAIPGAVPVATTDQTAPASVSAATVQPEPAAAAVDEIEPSRQEVPDGADDLTDYRRGRNFDVRFDVQGYLERLRQEEIPHMNYDYITNLTRKFREQLLQQQAKDDAENDNKRPEEITHKNVETCYMWLHNILAHLRGEETIGDGSVGELGNIYFNIGAEQDREDYRIGEHERLILEAERIDIANHHISREQHNRLRRMDQADGIRRKREQLKEVHKRHLQWKLYKIIELAEQKGYLSTDFDVQAVCAMAEDTPYDALETMKSGAALGGPQHNVATAFARYGELSSEVINTDFARLRLFPMNDRAARIKGGRYLQQYIREGRREDAHLQQYIREGRREDALEAAREYVRNFY